MSRKIFARPPVDRPYDRKLRLLVTDRCPHSCPYCHNEGMESPTGTDLSPSELAPFLAPLREFTQRVTISGGEPSCYPGLGELVGMLVDHDFETTVVTSKSTIPESDPLLHQLSSLHLSLHPSIGNRHMSAALADMARNLQRIRAAHPALRLSMNVVHGATDLGNQLFDDIVALMRNTASEVKFVSLFTPPNPGCLTAGADWETRWSALLSLLSVRGYEPHSSSPRDVRFHGADGTLVTLSDIGCISQDARYAEGHCFDTMDIVVTPSLQLQLCRWPGQSLPLSALLNRPGASVPAALAAITARDCKSCPFKTQPPPLARAQPRLARFVFDRHYTWPIISPQAADRAARLLRRGELSYAGANGVVARLEHDFAQLVGMPYALSTASGTLALYLAYHSLDLREGAEVVVPVYSYPGTVTPLVHLGAKIRFCDVDPLTGNIDPRSLASAVSPKTKAVVLTHMWGCPAPMAPILDICRRHNLRLVEDCSHATGATYEGRKVGTFGDFACFSLQSNKTVAAGEGGMLLAANRALFERAVTSSGLRNRVLDTVRGPDRRYWETGTGLKTKIHPLGAVIALENLRQLDDQNAARKSIALYMDEALAGCEGILAPKHDAEAQGRVYYTYKPSLSAALSPHRDKIIEKLIMAGLRMARSDLRPLVNTTLSREITLSDPGQGSQAFEGAEAYYRSILSLPLLYQAPRSLADFYISQLRHAVRSFAHPTCPRTALVPQGPH